MSRINHPLRWGVIGFGSFCDVAMAPALSKTEGHVIAGIQARSEGKAKGYAEKYHVDFWTTRPEALLERTDIDVIYVATPNCSHAQDTIMAAASRRHVVCEKPMARTAAEARSMVEACRTNGVKLMIGNMMRFNPCHAWARDYIKLGKLGEITAARGRFGFDLPSAYPLSTSPWIVDPQMAGGGALLSVGVHVVDLFRYLIGREVAQVSSLMETRGYSFPVDWASTALLKFEGGAIAEVRSSFDNRFEQNDLELFGTKGVMKVSGSLWRESTGVVETIGDNGKCRFEPAAGMPNPYVLQIEHFAECIRNDTEPLVNGVEGAAGIRICQAAYESARTGKTISLEDVA
jgi:predicted dehydrogenase